VTVRARVLVGGRVQGVYYRAEARDRARSLGVAGWVRNRADGRVEAVFEGERAQVESMLAWCDRGPPGAAVTSVETSWEDAAGERGFHVVG
jgi:acylphosphatase